MNKCPLATVIIDRSLAIPNEIVKHNKHFVARDHTATAKKMAARLLLSTDFRLGAFHFMDGENNEIISSESGILTRKGSPEASQSIHPIKPA